MMLCFICGVGNESLVLLPGFEFVVLVVFCPCVRMHVCVQARVCETLCGMRLAKSCFDVSFCYLFCCLAVLAASWVSIGVVFRLGVAFRVPVVPQARGPGPEKCHNRGPNRTPLGCPTHSPSVDMSNTHSQLPFRSQKSDRIWDLGVAFLHSPVCNF
jgi:hypothetical protein